MCYSDDGLTLLAALGVGDVAVLDLRMVRIDQNSIFRLLFYFILSYSIPFSFLIFSLLTFLFEIFYNLILDNASLIFSSHIPLILFYLSSYLPLFVSIFLIEWAILLTYTSSYIKSIIDDDISQSDAFMMVMVIVLLRYIRITQQHMAL